MPIRKEKRFCTIFTRTEAEKKAANVSKELDSTKEELNKTSEELEITKKALEALAKEVEDLKNSAQLGGEALGDSKETKKTRKRS